MKVTICFIGTGKYLNFLPKYYEYIEKNFLPGVEKKILVFSDGEVGDLPENISFYHQDHLKWPFITLKRFEIIQKSREEIGDSDWFIFMDADTLVVEQVTVDEIIDDSKDFIGVHHPCHFMKMNPHTKFPGSFEVNKKSLAAITEKDDTSVYWQGCLWGGKSSKVIELLDELESRINQDLDNGVVAIWHDESHLNKFFIENKEKVNTLSPSFAYPEVFSGACDFPAKVIHLSKDNSKYQV